MTAKEFLIEKQMAIDAFVSNGIYTYSVAGLMEEYASIQSSEMDDSEMLYEIYERIGSEIIQNSPFYERGFADGLRHMHDGFTHHCQHCGALYTRDTGFKGFGDGQLCKSCGYYTIYPIKLSTPSEQPKQEPNLSYLNPVQQNGITEEEIIKILKNHEIEGFDSSKVDGHRINVVCLEQHEYSLFANAILSLLSERQSPVVDQDEIIGFHGAAELNYNQPQESDQDEAKERYKKAKVLFDQRLSDRPHPAVVDQWLKIAAGLNQGKVVQVGEKNGYTTWIFTDNEIVYCQDHGYWRGIPSGVEFSVDRLNEGTLKLVAEGYGALKDNPYGLKYHYGNGAIYVDESDLPKYLHQGKEDKNV